MTPTSTKIYVFKIKQKSDQMSEHLCIPVPAAASYFSPCFLFLFARICSGLPPYNFFLAFEAGWPHTTLPPLLGETDQDLLTPNPSVCAVASYEFYMGLRSLAKMGKSPVLWIKDFRTSSTKMGSYALSCCQDWSKCRLEG